MHLTYRKKGEKDTEETQKSGQTLYRNNYDRKAKEGVQTKHKNNKTTRQTKAAKKQQRKQQHCLSSQKRYRREKNAGETPNDSKKYLPTENNFEANRKSPKGRHRDKTTHRRPIVHSTTSLPTNKKFETENFKMKKCDPGIG